VQVMMNDESMISFEGNDDGKESNDDNDDEESVIIPNPSDAITNSDYIPPRNDFSPVWDSIQAPGQMGCGYEDFAFFCENTDPTISCIFGRNAQQRKKIPTMKVEVGGVYAIGLLRNNNSIEVEW
jgi:hypothetical protein